MLSDGRRPIRRDLVPYPIFKFQITNKSSLLPFSFQNQSSSFFKESFSPFLKHIKASSVQIMGDRLVFAVKFKGECKLICLDGSHNFQFFLNQVRSKWGELNLGHYEFLCSVGSFSNCCLESDSDLKSIALLCNNSLCRSVEVVVSNSRKMNNDQLIPYDEEMYIGDGDIDNCPNQVLDFGEFGGIVTIPVYDVSPALSKKSFLSDSWSNLICGGVGSVFGGGSTQFKESLIKYSTQKGFKFIYKRNTTRYVHAVCKEDLHGVCDWFVKAKLKTVSGGFEIYKANLNHNCIGKLVNNKTKRLGPKIVGDLLMHDVKNKPAMCGKDVVTILKSNYGLDIPYYKAWRAVEAAKDQIFGSYGASYDDLRWYCLAVERTNPGSVVALECNSRTHHFERVFVAFKASLDGFKTCRPMLFIDGKFLRGRAKGTLLAATAKDGNNGLFPVAFAIVSAEILENWAWFLEKLRDHVLHEKKVYYISDRNTGLMAAFKEVFDEQVHFYCLYHLLLNLRGRFGSGWNNKQRADLGDHFTAAAYAPDIRIFNEKIEIFKELGEQIAEDWLQQLPFEMWSIAHSPHITRYGEMTSNAAEALNAWILDARELPVTRLIDSIRQKLQRWFVERRRTSDSWLSALAPIRQNQWDDSYDYGKSWYIHEGTGGYFEVMSDTSCTVHLGKRTCSCLNWQVAGFPCAHVVAVISMHCGSIYTYVNDFFYASTYRATYNSNLYPIPDTMRFECQVAAQHKILPPLLKRQPGRPKKQRIRSYGEFPKKKKYVVRSKKRKQPSQDQLICVDPPPNN